MEEDGSTVFAVYGYMNRGEHEGEVGVDVYYFDIQENAVNEIAFIPSTKSFAIAEEELGKMVYYNHREQLLYVLAGGVLYQVDVTKIHRKSLRPVWKRDSMWRLRTAICWRTRRTEN